MHVYSLISHRVQQTSQFTPLVLELSLIQSHLLWGELSAYSVANAIHKSPVFILPGTHHCSVNRGGIIWKACPTPLHIAGSVTRAPVAHPGSALLNFSDLTGTGYHMAMCFRCILLMDYDVASTITKHLYLYWKMKGSHCFVSLTTGPSSCVTIPRQAAWIVDDSVWRLSMIWQAHSDRWHEQIQQYEFLIHASVLIDKCYHWCISWYWISIVQTIHHGIFGTYL